MSSKKQTIDEDWVKDQEELKNCLSSTSEAITQRRETCKNDTHESEARPSPNHEGVLWANDGLYWHWVRRTGRRCSRCQCLIRDQVYAPTRPTGGKMRYSLSQKKALRELKICKDCWARWSLSKIGKARITEILNGL